jgi:CRP/FNR family transcriptional regulator, anaerobic regulatory protein
MDLARTNLGISHQEGAALNSQYTRLEAARVGRGLRSPTVGVRWTTSQPLTWIPKGLSAGHILYREGSVPERLFSLETGIVKEVTYLPDGRVRIVGLHGPDALLGFETSDVRRETRRHAATAIAITDVTASCTSSAEVHRIRQTRPEHYLNLLERHCETLRQAKRWIKEFYGDSTASRIARAIRYLVELQRPADTELVELLTCQEMAEIVGVSTESASRVLARFKRIGVLTRAPSPSGSRHYHFDAAAIDAHANN